MSAQLTLSNFPGFLASSQMFFIKKHMHVKTSVSQSASANKLNTGLKLTKSTLFIREAQVNTDVENKNDRVRFHFYRILFLGNVLMYLPRLKK